MPDFDDLVLSITGRLKHEFDFTFRTSNGDFANRVRGLTLRSNEPDKAIPVTNVSIDEDGDVTLKGHKRDFGSWYFTPSSVTVAGWLTAARFLREGHGLDDLGQLVEELYSLRSQFRPKEYDIRLFLYGRATPEGVSATLARSCVPALGAMLSSGAPSQISSGEVSATYQKGSFSDVLEFKASDEGVELRFIRSGDSKDFSSYSEFLRQANFHEFIEDIRPFAETFVMRAPTSRPR
jgi:hypothetical protein